MKTDPDEKSISVKTEIDDDLTKDEIIKGLEEQNQNILEAICDLSEKLEVQRMRNDQTEDEWFERCGEQALQLFIWSDADQELVRKMKENAESFVTILNRLVAVRKKEMKKLEEVKRNLKKS